MPVRFFDVGVSRDVRKGWRMILFSRNSFCGRRISGPIYRTQNFAVFQKIDKQKASIGRSRCHEHWHIDISYINCGGTFYYLCSVLDGFSRKMVHHELKEQMKEADVELILQRARVKYPDVSPRIISDNGPQFIARDFKDFIRLARMKHVKTSPYYRRATES